MKRRKPVAVLIRVVHPQAGEGWTTIDERELSRALYRHDDMREPIPYEIVKPHIAGVWADREYVESRGAVDSIGNKRPVITFDDWRERE